ncbi:hypothetical protein SAMN05444671_0574 [Flavobacterium sp. CF108]|uniref:hypothetical protein n=1 Tax=unclassified Flavobacterium TaxID=196869 RepID=UPI0008CE4FB0|nr:MULTISPECIES: hypothetical protein [unclassified Flavobacterium]SEO24034.1 hypothetical protein SAMN04487978_2504 [Flavobacterium sp. fv08]SHG48829.1 hypothetical protein SAMN05444671_0574 [Flavobacterium sp. CF108]
MKNLKEAKIKLVSKRVSSKLSLFGFIAIFILIIYSCSTSEEESLNKSGVSKTKTETVENKTENSVIVPVGIQENLNALTAQVYANTKNLDAALNKNRFIDFNAQAMQKLNTAKTESELKIAFEMGGIANSQEVINILKNTIANEQIFVSQNVGFYDFTPEQQTILINKSIEAYKNSNPPGGLVGTNNCARIFNKTIDRCADDYIYCAIGAIVGTAFGGYAAGLPAAATCMVSKLNCDGRAKEDYRECLIEPVSPDGPPPPTGELTLHCDRDSCWTTDSNGKFVERIID